MNIHAELQTLFNGPEPIGGRSPADAAAWIEEIELQLEERSDEGDDSDALYGPESWREIADTLSDPVEPT